jgi:senataxin
LFEQDGRNIDAVHSELAEISFSERSRAKKAAAGKAVADPVKLTSLPTVAVRQSLWVLAYDELSSRDVDGVALFMRAVVPFAHLELLDRGNAWSQGGLEAVVDSNQWITSVRSINKALKVTRESFAPALESLASHSNPLAIRELWKKSNASNIAIRLLLSPASEVHDPVISLIQHSFDDVDDRADCFRCLLRTAPDQAMDGLASFLRTFISVAQITPESCSLAKWMVRCFTDVLDALCSFSGGESALLQNEAFLADHSGGKSMMRRVGTLWSLMTESLALVFKRTAAWAPYYENEVMVDWMRDALIFGRHMTETMRGFEAAALGNANAGRFGDDVESPVKMTVVGQKMVRELEKVLRDLVSWIRLTE